MPDSYQTFGQGSALGAFAITPNDSTDLAQGTTRGIWVGAVGDIKVTFFDGTTATFTAVPASTIAYWPMRVKRVFATGTTATGLIGLL